MLSTNIAEVSVPQPVREVAGECLNEFFQHIFKMNSRHFAVSEDPNMVLELLYGTMRLIQTDTF